MDVLWLTAGLGYDGETISITAATQPALEELTFGALPWAPRIKLHNPVLAYETGDDFLAPFYRAAEGKLSPFILVVEGSVPNEHNKPQGYWASLGTDRATGQPIPTCDWIDRLAPNAWAVVAAGTYATYGGIHAIQGTLRAGLGGPFPPSGSDRDSVPHAVGDSARFPGAARGGSRFGRRRLSLPVSRPANPGRGRFDSGGGGFHSHEGRG